MPQILAVGAIVPRKGYDLLVTALAELRDLAWRLTIVGDHGRSPETAAELDDLIERARLRDRITCTGAVTAERLDALYRASDLFVQPSWFEGYGMALADALAYGLPIVRDADRRGAQNVGSKAGRLVTRATPRRWRARCARSSRTPACARDCAAAARAAAQNLPSWDDTAMAFEDALRRVG